jgi:hypothetical protein
VSAKYGSVDEASANRIPAAKLKKGQERVGGERHGLPRFTPIPKQVGRALDKNRTNLGAW